MMRKCQLLKKKNAKLFMGFLLLIGTVLAFLGWNAKVLWGVSPEWKAVEGIPKSQVVQDEEDTIAGAGRKSNVLFLLDVGSTMTFTPTGTLPDRETPGWTQEKAARMLKDCTYGSGGLPLVLEPYPIHGTLRYGRDLDSSNNATAADLRLPLADFMEKHVDNYYFPFNTTTHPLETLKHGSYGTPQPYALVLRNKRFWESAKRATVSDLVPNDSRMYKMKLVMWRLLEEATLFEHLRIGMATTFQEMNERPFMADFYKAEPFGAFKRDPDGMRAPFPHGVGPLWATGLPDGDNNKDPNGGYNDSQTAMSGILRDFYSAPKSWPQWVHMNRAVLRVPIVDYSTAHRDLFRMWIDGYENANASTSTHYYFQNPELFADGKTYLSTALFPGHPNLNREKLRTSKLNGYYGIAYSSKYKAVKASQMSAKRENRTYNIFNQGSGEALGTILDFFSPMTNAANVEVAPAASFPIKDACEANWVVVFTAGDDSQADEYTAAKAALDLFKYTKNNPVTKLKNGREWPNTFEQVRLEDGVRTIVVAFVDEKNPANEKLTKKLKAMAKAGDPIWNGSDWVPDESKEPYFANNVRELIEAMQNIMTRINSEIRPAKGPLTESSSLETAVKSGDFDFFAASYRVNDKDQWQGMLSRFQGNISKDRTFTVTQPAKWELGEALLRNRSKASGGSRKLAYWDGSSFKRLYYSTGSGEYDGSVAKLLGLRDEDLATPSKYSRRLHPTRALINWLHGYDYNYSKALEIDRTFMLSDFGQSGVVVVLAPKGGGMDLPGHREWIRSQAISGRAVRVFAQSNEGILHVINPVPTGTGLEDWAILPPPVMQPYRLAATKFSVKQTGVDMKADWDDGGKKSSNRRYRTPASENSLYHSRAAYVLDGPLYLSDFNLNQDGTAGGWGTYLIGMLGRAGNGLYVMDVTLPDKPKFLWFRETAYQKDGRPVHITMDGGASEPTYTEEKTLDMWTSGRIFTKPDNYPFYQMGYNMPRPVTGVAKLSDRSFRNFIALAGGYQEKLDLNNNGTIGAALYLLDPKNAYQTSVPDQNTKVFNSGSLAAAPSKHRTGSMVAGRDPYMGMLITPPAYLRSGKDKDIAGKVFTADNRGNIFMVNFEEGFGVGAASLAAKDWSIRTIGTLRGKNGENSADDNHCIPHGLLAVPSSSGTSAWVSGGTANAGTRNNDNNNDNSALIRNKGQHIFAFKVSEKGVLYRDDLRQLVNDRDTIKPTDNGWYVKLRAEGSNFKEEYVTTRAVCLGNKIFIATFSPSRKLRSCGGEIDGTGRIYAISLETGAGGWGNGYTGRAIEIRGAKIVGLTHSRKGSVESLIGNLLFTNRNDAQRDLAALAAKGHLSHHGDWFSHPESVASGVPFPPLSTYINYWREVK